MKIGLFAFLFLAAGLPGWHWLVHVREHNNAQAQAQAAAQRGQLAEAVYFYQQAVKLAGRGGPTPTLLLDLAQTQVLAGQLVGARATYGRLLDPAVPAAIGSAARQQLAVLLAQQQQVAQAVGLLRQALVLNPANTAARYNYELLSQYLAGQRSAPPPLPPAPGKASVPPTPRAKNQHDSTQQGNQGRAPSSGEQAGNDRPGTAPTPDAPPQADAPPASPRPSAGPEGRPDNQHPTPGSSGSAPGGFQPGSGERRPLPSGQQPGSERGLDAATTATGHSAPAGRGQRRGTEAATDADLQLQTQRARLKAMNLTPAQAQQLLEALRTSEQQYLQQRPRARQGTPPPPGTPTW